MCLQLHSFVCDPFIPTELNLKNSLQIYFFIFFKGQKLKQLCAVDFNKHYSIVNSEFYWGLFFQLWDNV